MVLLEITMPRKTISWYIKNYCNQNVLIKVPAAPNCDVLQYVEGYRRFA